MTLDIEPRLDLEDSDTQSAAYLTTFRELAPSEATSTSMELANKAFSHSLKAVDTTEITTTALNTDPFAYSANAESRYTSTVFMGIMIDTGASRKSTAGYSQFQALQLTDPSIQLDTLTKGQVNIQFGIGTTSLIGTTHVNSLIGKI